MIEISGKYSLIIVLSKCLLMIFEVGCVGTETNYVIGKQTIHELPMRHQLLHSIIEHDGCGQYSPWSNYTNPSFVLSNATCDRGCKIVSDLYEEHHQNHPYLISYGSCKFGLKVVSLQCKCLLTHHYARVLRWRTLQHCARNYLQDIVDFSIIDTPGIPEPMIYQDDQDVFFDPFNNEPREWMRDRAWQAPTIEGKSMTAGKSVDFSDVVHDDGVHTHSVDTKQNGLPDGSNRDDVGDSHDSRSHSHSVDTKHNGEPEGSSRDDVVDSHHSRSHRHSVDTKHNGQPDGSSRDDVVDSHHSRSRSHSVDTQQNGEPDGSSRNDVKDSRHSRSHSHSVDTKHNGEPDGSCHHDADDSHNSAEEKDDDDDDNDDDDDDNDDD